MKKKKFRQRAVGMVTGLIMGISLMTTGMGAFPAYAAAGDVAIDENNFPDAVFREYVKSFDLDGNNVLELSELNQVTKISVAYRKISDLTGVEHFSALKTLYCPDNSLASLNVSTNTALEELYCSNNNISGLDVSNNTKLTILSCFQNNISSLDVSNNTELERLYCSNNKLSSLAVSSNTKLTILSCANNNISSLDVSKNTKLVDLACKNNSLSSLNVSNNTELESLDCANNNISSLDVSKNTKLVDLACKNNSLSSLNVSNNTELESLDCANNNISSLDVSKNKLLDDLSCTDNNMSSLNVYGTEALKILSCYNNDLSALDISGSLNLEELYCYNNKISSLNVSGAVQLQTLNCSVNSMSSLDVSTNTQLRSLNCSNNSVTGLDLSKNLSLQALYCGSNKLSSLDVSNNTSLRNLWCSDNYLPGLDLSKNTTLLSGSMYLRLYDNQITAPLCKSGNTYYIDLSAVLPEIEKAGNPSKGSYDSKTGRINLSEALQTGDTLTYDYATGFGQTSMTVTITVSEVPDDPDDPEDPEDPDDPDDPDDPEDPDDPDYPTGSVTSKGIYVAEMSEKRIVAGMVTEASNPDVVEYCWYACKDGSNWILVKNWTRANEWLDWTPDEYGDYVLVCKARVGKDDSTIVQASVPVTYHPCIKGICQMPYTGEGGGFLIGVESYDNPNQSYRYELLILDCTLLAQGKPAWIYTTNKCTVSQGNAFWTVWQPQYGYYWTLFRVYGADGTLLDEACFGFENVY